MGIRREKAACVGMADALSPRVQQRLRGLLLGQPDRSLQSAEIIRLVGSGAGAAYRVLPRLADAGWVTGGPRRQPEVG